jgi:FAD:protein FMN transferase
MFTPVAVAATASTLVISQLMACSTQCKCVSQSSAINRYSTLRFSRNCRRGKGLGGGEFSPASRQLQRVKIQTAYNAKMAMPRSNRREFLKGKAARDALEGFADGFKAELPKADRPLEQPTETYLLEFARDAMAVEFQVLLNASQQAGSDAAVAALDLVERLEAQLTVYRDTSEVSRINQQAHETEVVVEPRLFALLQLAQQIARDTGGAYDMTSGPLSKVWGFYRRQGRMPGDEEVAEALPRVGYQKILLDEAQRTIRFAVAGMELNLGGIGKGHALDRMRELLVKDDVEHFLLHGGNSSVMAHGSRAGMSGWTVGLAHPLKSGERLAEFRLHNQALGTSGSGTQYFHHQGKRYGHIIDPRSGRPAGAVLSSTVIAPTAAEADALSTAFYVGGIDLAREYCGSHPEIGAVLVTQTGVKLQLEPISLADDAWTRLSD